MTELTEPDHATAQPDPEWPQEALAEIGQDITDPDVARAMARLLDIPQLPAADHEAAYNGLHDDLLAALNTDPAESGATGSGPAGGAA